MSAQARIETPTGQSVISGALHGKTAGLADLLTHTRTRKTLDDVAGSIGGIGVALVSVALLAGFTGLSSGWFGAMPTGHALALQGDPVIMGARLLPEGMGQAPLQRAPTGMVPVQLAMD